METPKWLLARTLAAIHEHQIAEHGGSGGIRDAGLLVSALARPENLYAYEEQVGLVELAAAYGYGIAKNHPYVDGNKRVAWVAMRTFLSINGLTLDATREAKYAVMYGVADGSVDEQHLIDWLKAHVKPRNP